MFGKPNRNRDRCRPPKTTLQKTPRLKIPKGWINCPRQTLTPIIDKFVSFKTPLDRKYDGKLPIIKRFNPEMLFSSMASMKVTLGLWIDLTNTDRYYNGSEIYGYVKIPCVGHDQPPTRVQAQLFIKICSTFIAQNPLQCIGVHCTHGFNRTGFMIVTYLIEILNFDVTSAIALFAAARPPGIYRQKCIDELFRRYSKNKKPFLAPELPDWSKNNSYS